MPYSAHVFATAKTTTLVDQGVATISVSGVISSAVSIQLLGSCEADMAEWRPGALVARYDAALMQIDAGQLLATSTQAMDHGSALRLPTALVVRPDDMEMWRTYCDLQGRRGILRAAFTNEKAAREWAAEYAALWAAQARYRLPV